MLRPRVIPSLLLSRNGLVKTVRFGNPTYVGDPLNAVRIYNEKEADELAVFDIDATAGGHEPRFELIGQLAAECRMPLCYGGGVVSAAQAGRIVGLGVEKVAISSSAVRRPELIAEMGDAIGGQSVVVVIDVKTSGGPSGYEVVTRNGCRREGLCPFELAKRAEQLGAGEIVVNSVDRDGEMKGYDLSLAERMRETVTVPLTFLGGAGSLADIGDLLRRCGCVGAAAGSLFVFKGSYRAVLINYPRRAAKDALVKEALEGPRHTDAAHDPGATKRDATGGPTAERPGR
ncbi:MAG: AglZ/HisF2 family acetamidino modification protein [Thermoanaerobaculia bacterium]